MAISTLGKFMVNFTNKAKFKPRNKHETMRPLTTEETENVFEKLQKYIGSNVKLLIDRPDGNYCFRLHREKVFYVSESIMLRSVNISRDNLISVGTCFGKFNRAGKFKLHITALTYMYPYAKYKVWLKPAAEQSFLYGNHVLKNGIASMTENTPQHEGVVVFSSSDLPLGFGVSAKSTIDSKNADPAAIIVYHQADLGEYLRQEETIA